MSIITLTRGQYSGGEVIAENLAKELGARCVSDEDLREAAKDYHVEESKLSDLFDKPPNLLERMTHSRFIYVAYVKATLLNLCKDNNIIYHGNAGQEMLRDVPHAFKIRLMLSREFRVLRIMEQFNSSQEDAERMVDQIDDERTKRTQYYYDADWRISSRYDLMIRMDGTVPPFVENTILEMARQPRFQLTEEKEAAFKDVLLQANLQAMAAGVLGRHISMINLGVHDQVVTLEGSLPSTDTIKLDQLIEEFRATEGVKEVIPELSAGFVLIR